MGLLDRQFNNSNVIITSTRQPAQLGEALVALADAVRPGLLRDRDDGHRRVALRFRPVRRDPARHPPAVRRDDRRGHRDAQDGEQDQAPLRPDGGTAVRHLDGKLLQLRRPLLGARLPRAEGRRPGHPRRRVRPGLSSAARGPDGGPHQAAGKDPPRHPRQRSRPDHDLPGDRRAIAGELRRGRPRGQVRGRRRPAS